VEETATWTLEIISTMLELMEATRTYVQAALPTIYRHELVNLLFEWPYVRIANVVDAGLMERQTASRHLRELVRIGVLQEQSSGREKLFINRRFLTLLTTEQRDYAPFPES